MTEGGGQKTEDGRRKTEDGGPGLETSGVTRAEREKAIFHATRRREARAKEINSWIEESLNPLIPQFLNPPPISPLKLTF